MSKGRMTAMSEDKKWQAESDVRTLAEAETIKKDAARLKAAGKAAESMKEKKMDEAKAMAKIARHGK